MSDNIREAIKRMEKAKRDLDKLGLRIMEDSSLTNMQKHDLMNGLGNPFNWTDLALRFLRRELEAEKS